MFFQKDYNAELRQAAFDGNLGKVKELVSQDGVDINCQNISTGNTPLHLAAKHIAAEGLGDLGCDCYLYLKDSGAQDDIKNRDGKTASELFQHAILPNSIIAMPQRRQPSPERGEETTTVSRKMSL